MFTLSANVIRGAPLRPGKHIGPIFVSPGSQAYMTTFPGRKATSEISITSEDKPVKILRVEGAEQRVSGRVEVIEPGRSYKIIVDSLPTDRSDLYRDKLIVLTDDPTLPAFPISIALRVYSNR